MAIQLTSEMIIVVEKAQRREVHAKLVAAYNLKDDWERASEYYLGGYDGFFVIEDEIFVGDRSPYRICIYPDQLFSKLSKRWK